MLLHLAPLAAGASLLLLTGGLFAACLRLPSVIAFLLATVLAAWTLTIGFLLALSPAHAVRQWTTWGWLGGCLAAAVAAWATAGRPTPPLAGLRAAARIALRERPVAALALLAALGLAYASALAVSTPENEGDALVYHVARAALWHQQHAVAYVQSAVDSRINGNPPNAEIGDLLTMILTGTQRYVGLVQLVSAVALALATAGVARRLRLPPTAAAFSGLTVLTFPVVITQTWTALNDIVVAAFLVTAVYFMLGERRTEMALGAVAAGLAVGTKFDGLLSLPILVIVALAAPGRRVMRSATLIGGAVFVGCPWYLVNLVETGKLDGGLSAEGNRSSHVIAAAPQSLRHFALGAIDLSGSGGWNSLWFWGVGAAMAAVAFRRPGGLRRLLPGLSVALVPSLAEDGYRVVCAAWPRGGEPGLNTTAGAIPSWYGPLGAATIVIGVVLAVRTRERTDRLRLILALAPALLAVCYAFTIAAQHGQGRYFVFGFALAAAAAGAAYRHRGLAWAITAVGGVSLVLSLVMVQSKPSGLAALGAPSPAVWGRPTWWTQSILRPGTDDREVLRVVQNAVPARATLALALRPNDFLSPYFGPDLERRVELLRSGDPVSPAAGWLVVAPGASPPTCSAAWRVVHRSPSGWLVEQRLVRTSACSATPVTGSQTRERVQQT